MPAVELQNEHLMRFVEKLATVGGMIFTPGGLGATLSDLFEKHRLTNIHNVYTILL
jgi:hypothetical protein